MANKNISFAVLGAGSWGTALAMVLANNAVSTRLWARNPEHVSAMQQSRTNLSYLGDVLLPDGLILESSLEDTVNASDIILIAVPCSGFRDLLKQIADAVITQKKRIVWACKGFEMDSRKLLHEVADEVLGSEVPVAIISGPNFAKEVAQGVPTATTIASENIAFAEELASYFHNGWFRAYASDDITGVELGGALKNVLAIAVGISDGLGLGANTRAALLTRGLNEIVRFSLDLGAKSETFMGLAGFGDLILTCTDDQSRNRRLGLALATEQGLEAAVKTVGQTVEGVKTAKVIYEIASERQVDMPIMQQIYRVLYEDLSPGEAVKNLLAREQKSENI